jgi:NAD(P)-dependent dehydrogenase (short-subunit alcohol dehydrogenase family)
MVRRVGELEDTAHAVVFLCSIESGQILTVDGGRMEYIAIPEL